MFGSRARRGLAGGLAAILAGTLLGTLPASAAWSGTPSGDAEQEPRFISIRGVEPREDVFFVRGAVEPEYAERRATIERRVGPQGRWRDYRTFRTSATSTYRQQVSALRSVGRVYYRVRVEASGGFRTSRSGAVFIHTRRSEAAAASEGQVEAAVGLDPVDEGLALQ